MNEDSPLLAIELDDDSHWHPDRQARDAEVERVLKSAGLPLLRVKPGSPFSPQDVTRRVEDAMEQSGRQPPRVA